MRVAVLGLGSAGARHAGHLRALGHAVTGFDPAGVPAPKGVRAVASQKAAIEEADAVVVASPNALHAKQALAALRAGRPVLVEKPLAVAPADAAAVAEEAERRGLVCGVAVNLRFHPALALLRDLVASGALGGPLTARAWFGHDLREWRPGTDWHSRYSARADLGGGVVLDAIHELDYLLWLLGPAGRVAGVTGTVGDLDVDVEDVAAATIAFSAGHRATVDLNYLDPVYRRGCELIGPAGAARWDWATEEVVVRTARRSSRDAVPCDLQDTYRAIVEDFVRAVSGGGAPICPARAGAEAVVLADAIKRSRGAELAL